MADSFWQGTTDGSTSVFTVPFNYIEQTDVLVQLNGVTMLTPGDYNWTGPSSIQFLKTPPSGFTLGIYRQTSPDSRLVNFNDGAILTGSDLNTATLQCFYRTQELQDALNNYINGGVSQYSVTGTNPFVTPDDLINAAAAAVLQSALAQTLLGAMTDINLNAQSILTNSNQLSTLQGALDNLTSSIPAGIGTYLTNETDSRIAGDQALADTISLIGAVSSDNATFVLDTSNVYVDASTSMADKFTGLESLVDANTAAVTAEATTRADADSATADTLAGLITTVGANTAAIATESTVRATADSATASTITSLTTTVAGNTSSISEQATSINGLQAQYVVKIDANGNVAGYGLAAGGGSPSQFTVLANKFSVIDPGNPGSTPTVPFNITGGVCLMQNVVIGGALIQNATITGAKMVNATIGTAQIANASITNALIANAAIESAQIANLAVTNAHIANLAVDSLKIAVGAVQTTNIAAGAVSNDASTVQSGIYAIPSAGGNALTLVYTSSGGKLLILSRGDLAATASGSGGTSTCTLQLIVNGTVYDQVQSTATATSFGGSDTEVASLSGIAVLTPAAGNNTITLHGSYTGTNASGDVANGRLFVIEFFK